MLTALTKALTDTDNQINTILSRTLKKLRKNNFYEGKILKISLNTSQDVLKLDLIKTFQK